LKPSGATNGNSGILANTKSARIHIFLSPQNYLIYSLYIWDTNTGVNDHQNDPLDYHTFVLKPRAKNDQADWRPNGFFTNYPSLAFQKKFENNLGISWLNKVGESAPDTASNARQADQLNWEVKSYNWDGILTATVAPSTVFTNSIPDSEEGEPPSPFLAGIIQIASGTDSDGNDLNNAEMIAGYQLLFKGMVKLIL
jgi:hypothetical protein